jgi:hypothetical protein
MWKEEYPRFLGDKEFILAVLNKVPKCKVRFIPIIKIVMEISLPIYGLYIFIHICVMCASMNYVH